MSEILVADTDSESCAETSVFEDEFEEEEEEEQQQQQQEQLQQQQQQASEKNHRLQQVAEDYQIGDGLKEGTQIFILLSVQHKV